MPRMGEAHDLLSPTHPDTQPPADGADPSDGQVPTWSDALKAWTAQDPAPGGVTVHKDLLGLDADDHSIYALLSGRSGGQALIGGLAASEHLTLQSTAHATRGYVRAQDDLQLLTGILRDPGGNARLQLDAASPHVAVTGDLLGSNHLALGGAEIASHRVVNIEKSLPTTPAAQGMSLACRGSAAAGVQVTAGMAGYAIQQGTPTVGFALGLDYGARHGTSSPLSQLIGLNVGILSMVAGTGTISTAWGMRVPSAAWGSSKPGVVYGIEVQEQGGAGVGTAEGLRIADQTAITVRLLELGPTVPYLRLLGGGDPAANESNLSLKLGATLKQVTEGAADGGGAGFRVLRVAN